MRRSAGAMANGVLDWLIWLILAPQRLLGDIVWLSSRFELDLCSDDEEALFTGLSMTGQVIPPLRRCHDIRW